MAFFRLLPRPVLIACAIALIGIMWTGSFFAGYSIASVEQEQRQTLIVAEEVSPAERIADSEPLPALRLRTCVPDFGALGSLDGALFAAVSTPEGEPLWATQSDVPIAPASVLKLFTVVAGWRVLGPDHRLTTRVVAGENPGEVWLIGGGDATLTRSPGTSYYNSESNLQDLANQVIAANASRGGPPITTVHLDNSRYRDFPTWNDSWREGAWALGYVAPITSIQVDGDRDDPAGRLSPRSQDPVGRAGAWFAEALVAAGNPVLPSVGSRSVAPSGAAVLAEVRSAPLSELIGPILRDSDNTLAEILAREVALTLGTTSLQDALVDAVAVEGADEIQIVDGSGLSPENRVDVATSLAIVNEIALDSALEPIRESLARSGDYGSLRDRFPASEATPVMSVSAKTGSIGQVRSLAGFVETTTEDTLAFSIALTGAGVDDASRDDIDGLVTALATCGENLAHWTPAPQ